jgi:hypothetical protein
MIIISSNRRERKPYSRNVPFPTTCFPEYVDRAGPVFRIKQRQMSDRQTFVSLPLKESKAGSLDLRYIGHIKRG